MKTNSISIPFLMQLACLSIFIAALFSGCGSLVRVAYQTPAYGGGSIEFQTPQKGGYAK